MKYLLIILSVLFSGVLKAQYNPTLGNVSNNATGYSQQTPSDMRSQYFDVTYQKYRDYASKSEAVTYLSLIKYRSNGSPIFIHEGGTLSAGVWIGGIRRIYIFKDSTDLNSLVPWSEVTSVNGRKGDVVIGNADSIRGRTVDTTVASGTKNNYLLAYDSTNKKWKLTAPASAYTSGTGISIVGNVISADNATALWNANSLRGRSITTSSPSVGQTLSWNGVSWIYSSLNGLDTAYTNGDTLFLVNTFDTIPVLIKTLYNADDTLKINEFDQRQVFIPKNGQLLFNGLDSTETRLLNGSLSSGLFSQLTSNYDYALIQHANPVGEKVIRLEESSTGILVRDNIDNKGMFYDGDYSDNQISDSNAVPSVKTVKRLISDSIATAGNANNGLSKSGSNIVLGQDYGDGSNPAALSSYREIPIGNYALVLTGTGGIAGAQTQMYGSSVTVAGDSTNNATGAVNIGDITNPGKYLELRGFPAYGSVSYDGGNNIKVLPNGNTEIKRLYVTDSLNIGKVSTGLSTDSVLVKGPDAVVRKILQSGYGGFIKNDTVNTQNGGFKLGAGSKIQNDTTSTTQLIINGNSNSSTKPFGSAYNVINLTSQSSVYSAGGNIVISRNAYFNNAAQGFTVQPGNTSFVNLSPQGYAYNFSAYNGTANASVTHVTHFRVDTAANAIIGGTTYPGSLLTYGLDNYNSNIAGSYTSRSKTDKNYVDSADAARSALSTLQSVTNNGNTTTNSIAIGSSSAPSYTLDITGKIRLTDSLVGVSNSFAATNTATSGYTMGSNILDVSNSTSSSGLIQRGILSSVRLSAANTQNNTNAQGLVPANFIVSTVNGASGTVSNASCVRTNLAMGNSSTITNGYLHSGFFSTSGGSVTNATGMLLYGLGVGTNNTGLFLSTATSSPAAVSGNYAIYDATGYQSYHAGPISVNTTTTGGFGLNVNRSVAINKDSATRVTSIGTNVIALIDTATNKVQTITPINIGVPTAGSFSGVGTATTTFTVTIGVTMSNATYKVNVTPTAALSAALFYVTNKTTTTFDVVYLSGLTGTVTFDWSVFK